MPGPMWSAAMARGVVRRVVVEADLVLETPAHLGNGDGDDLTDMVLLTDPRDGRTPLLTGASLGGALRAHLRSTERGHRSQREFIAERTSLTALLFGGQRGDDAGEQSPLLIGDALGTSSGVELREGVRLDPASRTAEEDKLFDLELWPAGTAFLLRLELLIRQQEETAWMKQALFTALAGLQDGSITLGARKRRGYGRVGVRRWRAREYDLAKPVDLLDWLDHVPLPAVTDLAAVLGADSSLLQDRRKEFRLRAMFRLNGSLLIRSGGGKDDQGPDMIHLHSRQRDGKQRPVLSGTSLAGSLRARARRIAETCCPAQALALVEGIFGREMIGDVQPCASRLDVEEHVVEEAETDLVQNRVSIDRFTGGARATALFNQQPAFGKAGTRLTVGLTLINPEDHEVGLLLHLLKDLWTGDLPLGGEASVGRGRLAGLAADLTLRRGGQEKRWKIAQEANRLIIDDRTALEAFAAALTRHGAVGGGA
jgi:CRISPR/Cas system CSM-associated protein Csm3 (group 7 of RAMP superfamily)